MTNSFDSRSTLKVGSHEYEIFRLDKLPNAARLPYSLRILLENLLRTEDGVVVTADHIRRLADWDPKAVPNDEIAFSPARVLLQDFTGVPAVVDLAAMRDAMARLGGDPRKINPLQPVELVIDHSVQIDAYGSAGALKINQELDYSRNGERYRFLKWGQKAFDNFKVVPPNNGICHQVNLEFLSRVVFGADGEGKQAYPDTLVGTDSHTPMANGLGVLGWGVGGIEAEAAMLGQAISMLVPQVIGFKLEGSLPEGTTATDLVLTITEMLRKKGVVGKFVEFYGSGIANLALADRATIGNMTPEYGATCAIFPVDQVTLDYLRFTGRSEERVALVEAYMKEQGLFHTSATPEPVFTDTLVLDLSQIEPSIAGPKRPQDRIRLSQAGSAFRDALPSLLPAGRPANKTWGEGGTETAETHVQTQGQLQDGSVVIASITSCTNTSNPSVMLAAGLLAKKAVEKGLTSKPWVKTSLAPGSRVVTDYYAKSGLDQYLDQLGFQTVGYGCTTCIGNSGPLPTEVSQEIAEEGLVVASVLSGNRNFEGRIHSEVRANFLMSPPLVVAFALAGRVDRDLYKDALGQDKSGKDVFLKDIWPSHQEIEDAKKQAVTSEMFTRSYGQVYHGDEQWRALEVSGGDRYNWDPQSTYVRQPTYFDDMPREAPEKVKEITGARVLAVLGDSVTTDHISPAGSIKKDGPAGRYLISKGVEPGDFNSYGARRGNHECMVRGTFANVRIKNRLAPGTEGGVTTYLPTGEVMSIYDAAEKYQASHTPTMILAGKEYGSGSSRDWAAKGPYLQGIKAVIAESYERIHRSNLIGMGILPLQFAEGESIESLGLTGHETFEIVGLTQAIGDKFAHGRELTVKADAKTFKATVRIDTPQEIAYYRHGGILQYVLRQLLSGKEKPTPIPQVTNPHPEENVLVDPDKTSQESFPASDPASI